MTRPSYATNRLSARIPAGGEARRIRPEAPRSVGAQSLHRRDAGGASGGHEAGEQTNDGDQSTSQQVGTVKLLEIGEKRVMYELKSVVLWAFHVRPRGLSSP